MTRQPKVDQFLAEVMPMVHDMDVAFHNGNVAPRVAVWSHTDPVTLFGAVRSGSGWDEILPMFELLASQFSNGSFEYEVVAADVSGDLGYIVGFEHTTAAFGSAKLPNRYDLRVTTNFRREDGEWKIVHRHADPVPGSAGTERQMRDVDRALASTD
ncbi:MAG: nuclear transport factor 2 family protein [Chloroflexi bacterium]|nr:nuclear transport factor 2 family protein [Chloroflexota bacterium]